MDYEAIRSYYDREHDRTYKENEQYPVKGKKANKERVARLVSFGFIKEKEKSEEVKNG